MAAAQLILDTDIIIDHLRQRGEALRLVLAKYHCGMTAITLYELLAVPKRSERQSLALNNLLNAIQILPFDHSTAKQSADIWRSLSTQGSLIGLPDILTAGTCLANDLPLLTRNSDHFGRINRLQLIDPDDLSHL